MYQNALSTQGQEVRAELWQGHTLKERPPPVGSPIDSEGLSGRTGSKGYSWKCSKKNSGTELSAAPTKSQVSSCVSEAW